MKALDQLLLLMWKNFLVQKRKLVVTIFEILLPALFTVILIIIRVLVTSTDYPDATVWPSYSVDQLGGAVAVCVPSCLIYYSPNTSDTASNIMIDVQERLVNVSGVVGFATEDELVDALMEKLNEAAVSPPGVLKIDNTLAGVVFTDIPDNIYNQPQVTYKLRFPNTLRPTITPSNNDDEDGTFGSAPIWRTDDNFDFYQSTGPRNEESSAGGPPSYDDQNFLALQYGVDRGIISVMRNSTDLEGIEMVVERTPYPPYIDDEFIIITQQQLGLIIMLSFVFTAMQLAKDVLYEKEMKLKESMKMMGISGWLHWLAWFIKYFLYMVIIILIQTLLMKIDTGSNGPVINYTPGTIVYVFLLSYGIATITFCFALSTLFSKATTGAAFVGILFFLTFIPYYFLYPRYSDMSLAEKIASCLLSNVALAFGCQLIGMFEGTGSGVQWSTVDSPVSVDDNFTLLYVILMLLIDSLLYMIIAWYIEAINPGDFGVPQPFYFPFTRYYWCGSSSSKSSKRNSISPRSDSGSKSSLNENSDSSSSSTDDGSRSKGAVGTVKKHFEREPTDLPAGIRISHLRKEFRVSYKKKKVAVSDMTLNMYEGQITALLGHNGAGKTTTMSILTGFLPPTSGTAIVNGYDIREDLEGVRSSLGLCPQHDVLFDMLTVREHMIFFTKVKGFPKKLVNEEVERMIEDMGLEKKANKLSSTLSGGMKRKLCVGIALTANSKVVILDEPTSGMDPNARRQVWDLLQKHRSGRTMVLSTHFMDEADLLGDRIAIMANGVVQCCGSSLFLKKNYGIGYHMVLVKEPDCDVDQVSKLVHAHVAGARLESNVSAELSYNLPRDCTANFEQLLLDIERLKESLRISSYGASVTSMEEVFLRVGRDLEANGEDSHKESNGFHNPDPQVKSNGHIQDSTSVTPPAAAAAAASNGYKHTPEDHVKVIVVDSEVGGSHIGSGGKRNSYDITSTTSERSERNEGCSLYSQQFYGMFVKRALHTARNWSLGLSQLLIPLAFTIIALVIVLVLPDTTSSPPLTLNLAKFDDVTVSYGTGANASANASSLAEYYRRTFLPFSPGVRTVFVNNVSGYTNDPDVQTFLINAGEQSIGGYKNHYLLALEIEPLADSSTGLNVTTYFSNEAYHASAMSLNAFDNAMFGYLTGRSDVNITTINHPLPQTVAAATDMTFSQGMIPYVIAENQLFGMSFLASSFAMFLLKERAVKAKHSQTVSGIHPFTFWFSTLCWDFINYLIPVAGIMLTYLAFDTAAYLYDGRWAMILLFYALFGWAVLPFMYLLSFAFTVPSSGYVWITVFNILSGLGTFLIVAILNIPELNTESVADALDWLFVVTIPNYGLGKGLLSFYTNYQFLTMCSPAPVQSACEIYQWNASCCTEYCTDNCYYYSSNYLSLSSSGIGWVLIFFALQGIVYFLFVFLIEFNFFTRLSYCFHRDTRKQNVKKEELHSEASVTDSTSQSSNLAADGNAAAVEIELEDSDVTAERSRLHATPIDQLLADNSLVLMDLCKKYGDFRAVDRLNVGIVPGECFGLLGINGAGKTTTFKMLTGDAAITSGTAYLGGYNIKTDLNKIQSRIGYCPQFDALIDQMTPLETLYMYGRIRGVRESNLKSTAWDLINLLQLNPHANKIVKSCSGGNKRKLSTAVALIGDPLVIFLDEPSTGVDPVARRHLWTVLSQVRASGKTLVLTSHSMEECDALCTRIAIMVNGKFKCLGSPQHLKNKFGTGYTVIVKVCAQSTQEVPDVSPVKQFIESSYPGAILKDVHNGLVQYQIPDTAGSLGTLFGTMESVRERLNIEDYSVNQTTLEDIFIGFARAQQSNESTDDDETGCKARCACSSITSCCRT